MKVFKPKKEKRPAFRRCALILFQNKKWKLFHGFIQRMSINGKIQYIQTPHAWLQFQGMCYDPIYNLYLPEDRYYKTFLVSNTYQYTFKQMEKNIAKFKRYFNWEA